MQLRLLSLKVGEVHYVFSDKINTYHPHGYYLLWNYLEAESVLNVKMHVQFVYKVLFSNFRE